MNATSAKTVPAITSIARPPTHQYQQAMVTANSALPKAMRTSPPARYEPLLTEPPVVDTRTRSQACASRMLPCGVPLACAQASYFARVSVVAGFVRPKPDELADAEAPREPEREMLRLLHHNPVQLKCGAGNHPSGCRRVSRGDRG
jgi:hypothetical protein